MRKFKKLVSVFLALILCMTMLPVTASAAELSMGSRGTQVKYLQVNLNGLGYGNLDVDGQFGSATKASVIKFQKAYKLSADGIAGSKTLGKLDDIITDLQKDLKSLGYNPGSADGIYGDNTKSAVKKFQSANNLKATGIADQETLKKINNASSFVQINGTYTLTTALKKGMVLDVSGNGTANGTNIQIYSANGTDAQSFVITHLEKGWHKIIGKASGKAIDVTGGTKASGINVQLYQYNGSDAQKWKFVKVSDGVYYIQNKLGYYLDVSGAKTGNGTNVQVYTLNKSDAQKWKLSKASNNNTASKNDNSTSAKAVYDIAHNEKGNSYRGENFKYSKIFKCDPDDWCGFYAGWVLKNAYEKVGANCKDYIPFDRIPGACGIAEAYQSGKWGEYYSFTTWEYKSFEGKPSSNRTKCVPKVGDIALIETMNGISDGPDHVALIIKVNADGSFVTSEGNTGEKYGGDKYDRKVQEIKYIKKNGMWQRENGGQKVHMICSVQVPK